MEIIKTSSNIQNVYSDIRGEIYELALKMEREGEKVLKLNTGNPAAFGFKMPESIKRVVTENIEASLGYCNVRGMLPARETICDYHRKRGIEDLSVDNIFICNGVSEAAEMLCTALVGKGDEVLVPTPCYSLWSNSTYLAGGTPVYYNCDEENGWNPDVNDIEKKITPATKAILVINPNNPTGAVYSAEVLTKITLLAEKHNLVVISDEIYDRLIFDNKPFTSTAALNKKVVTVTLNGLSKSHCICGFRCGWMAISGPEEKFRDLVRGINTLASMRLCSNAIMQLCIPDALTDNTYTKEMMADGSRLDRQRKAVYAELDKIPEISYVKNDAAFYLFPKINKDLVNISNDKLFAKKLLEQKHILVVAGSGFNYTDNYHFRIVMLPEAEILGKATAEIGDFLKNNRNI